MDVLRTIHRRLDRLQHGMRFRIATSAVAAVLCGAVFGALLVTTYDLDGQRSALVDALSGQNLQRGDEHAVSLARDGTVTVAGRTYGGVGYHRNIDLILDREGNVERPSALAERMLSDQVPAWAPRWMLEQPETTWLLAGLTTAWLLAIIWIALTLPFFLTCAATAVVALPLWLLGADGGALAVAGMGVLTFTFILLTRLAQLALDQPIQVLAVAHTVVKEASRSRLSLVFIVFLLVTLPLLPVWLNDELPLRFQIQTFIARSMGLTFFVVACLTLFLSTATVAFEIRDRQIWQLMTKPLNRLSYLIGKWIGVVTINLILLAVAGVATFIFIQYLRERPVASGLAGQLDALAIQNEVLTARRSQGPDYEQLTSEQLAGRVEQRIDADLDLAGLEEVPLPTLRRLAAEVRTRYQVGQRTIPPQLQRTYAFSGLLNARERGGALTLKYRFHILEDDEHQTFQAYFVFNEDPDLIIRRDYVPTMVHVMPVPTRFIQDDGRLRITIANPYQPPPDRRGFGAINFEDGDFEVLYRVGNFEPNFVRALLINWVKLGFLAMLGVCSATFLSFAVACLLSFTVFIAGIMGPFLAESLALWYPPPTSQMDWTDIAMVLQWAFQWVVKAVAEVLVWSLEGFAEISATRRLVEGKFISWMDVLGGFLKLIVVWSSVTLGIGWWVIRSRQLAIYSGQG